jgi:hypothetical protein
VRTSIRDWLLFAFALVAAFLVGGAVFGRVEEILNVCTTRCSPVEQYVSLNVGAGLSIATLTAVVLLLIGRRRSSR